MLLGEEEKQKNFKVGSTMENNSFNKQKPEVSSYIDNFGSNWQLNSPDPELFAKP